MSYIPWPMVENVLKTKRTEIEAICISLPCQPKLVVTPKLLELLSGSCEWNKEILSTKLFKLYAAMMFLARTHCKEDELFTFVVQTLKMQQKEALDNFQCNSDDDTFILAYLNAYEYAILKYLRLLKKNRSTQGDIDLTKCILNMGEHTRKQCQFEQLITSQIVHKVFDKTVEKEQAQQNELCTLIENKLKVV